MTGLAITAGSGCGLIEKGDLGSGSCIHLEAKCTRTNLMTVQLAWIQKAAQQARDYDKKFWMLQLAFSARHAKEEDFPILRFLLVKKEMYREFWSRTPPVHPTFVVKPGDASFGIDQKGETLGTLSTVDAPLGQYVLFPESWLTPDKVKEIEDYQF